MPRPHLMVMGVRVVWSVGGREKNYYVGGGEGGAPKEKVDGM